MTKVIFAILLVCLVAVSTASLNKCQRKADGTRLAHPYDCTQFLVCGQHQVAHVLRCPSGLHFNRHLGECDLKAAAGCEWFVPGSARDCVCDPCCSEITTTPTPTTTNTTLPTPITPAPTTPTPTIPTTASTATPVPTPTPSVNTTASTATPTPAPTPSVPTPTPSVPTPTPSIPTTPGSDGCYNNLTICEKQENNLTFPYDGYCNKWITCQGGCSLVLTCPNNLHWVKNGTNGYCDYPQNLSPACQWPSSPPETGPSGISCSNQGNCGGKSDGFSYIDPNNSSSYVVCQCECPLSRTCPQGLVFNDTSKVCGWPAGYGTVPELVVACDNNITTCKDREEGELIQVEGSCTTFYKCNFGCAVLQQCPSGLHYDKDAKQCDYVNNVKCPWPYTPPSGPSAGPSGIACASGGRCVGQDEGETFPSAISCGSYVVCQCECEREMPCPEGLSWDSALKRCDYSGLVDCV